MSGVPWNDRELGLLRRFYASIGPPDLRLLAKITGRDRANICRKARELGLTNQRRPKKAQLGMEFGIARLSKEQRSAHLSKKAKQRIARDGHPRGMLGKKHKPETLAAISRSSLLKWQNPDSFHNSTEYRQQLSDRLLARMAIGQMRPKYTRCRGGRREDLGDTYFRSSWEANYARYLNFLVAQGKIASWEYEAKTFVFETIKRGSRAYTPDFKVLAHDGSHEWHEVKGWMDQKSKTKLARMARHYPTERVVVIGEGWFRSAKRNGIASSLPGWE